MTYVCNVKYGTFHISHCHIFLLFIDIYIFTFVKKMSTVKISNAAANGTLLISD